MANFSCYITIKNDSTLTLTNVRTTQSFGEYKSRPSTNLKPGESTSFRLADTSGPAGSTGTTTYDVGDGNISINYDCPYGDDSNKLGYTDPQGSFTWEIYGNNDEGYTKSPKGNEGNWPSDGHPLSGLFIITDAS